MDHIPLEKPIVDLESHIDELKRTAASKAVSMGGELEKLEDKAKRLREKLFSNLSAHEVTQLSRHPRRPNTLEYVGLICSDFVELHGDRNFYDDPAIVGGMARLGEWSVMVVGHQKGRGTKDNIFRNFGMPKPEGYRKALRLMSMAERLQMPIITFVDTPGAYPGVGAEERGQSEAIGKNILVMSRLRVPIITVVSGEGGSGGALAIAVANRVHMLRYSIYSVISPEGCASILMKDASQAAHMAEALRVTSDSAFVNGLIDSVIDEPLGGAHRDPHATAAAIRVRLLADLDELGRLTGEELAEQRARKFLGLGAFTETAGG